MRSSATATIHCSATCVALLCAVLSCTDGKSSVRTGEPRAESPTKADPQPPKPKPTSTPARTWPADTPSATRCTTSDECIVVLTAPGDDPCCDVTVTIGPRKRDYLEFVETYRRTQCLKVECPPLALPGAQPAPCAQVARCIDGKCGHACNDPTYDADADADATPTPADPCVTACVDSRRMQAISAEAIEQKCRADCASGTFTP